MPDQNVADWRRVAKRIHETVAKQWPVYGDEDRRFLALALAGEAGEIANLIKKEWRGDFTGYNPQLAATDQELFQEMLRGELADVRIYLELLAAAYSIDLDAACAEKIPELLRRWPEAREAASSDA